MSRRNVTDFIHNLAIGDLPSAVVDQARRCLLDLAGVAAAGSATRLSRLAREHAAEHFAAGGVGARILLDGRRVSPAGAALAGGMSVDSLDAHDGHALAKGHAGAAVLPALLAFADSGARMSGPDLLVGLVVGYEIGTRAGIALHATARDYHSSGSWNALACAAVGARARSLSASQTRHALGVAEYHGPRSPMMRCIEHPSMVKDGSGWGAMAGVSATFLAAMDFTGAPAATLAARTGRAADVWADLGSRWRMLEQYHKPQPVCRWAQPAIRAALDLRNRHHLTAGLIEQVEVVTFREATRLATCCPATTEEAQYSLPFAVATALSHGGPTVTDVTLRRAQPPEVARLGAAMALTRSEEFDRRFPGERCATVRLRLRDGRRLSATAESVPGDPDEPLSAEELEGKFRTLATPVLGCERSTRLAATIGRLPQLESTDNLLDDLLEAPPPTA